MPAGAGVDDEERRRRRRGTIAPFGLASIIRKTQGVGAEGVEMRVCLCVRVSVCGLCAVLVGGEGGCLARVALVRFE